jgi:hypothetical protein
VVSKLRILVKNQEDKCFLASLLLEMGAGLRRTFLGKSK